LGGAVDAQRVAALFAYERAAIVAAGVDVAVAGAAWRERERES